MKRLINFSLLLVVTSQLGKFIFGERKCSFRSWIMHLIIRLWLCIFSFIGCEIFSAIALPEGQIASRKSTDEDNKSRRATRFRFWNRSHGIPKPDNGRCNPKEGNACPSRVKKTEDASITGSCHAQFVPARGIIHFVRHAFRRRPKHKRLQRPRLAYKMALLANLAYWQFHQWKDEVTKLPISGGFRIKHSRQQKGLRRALKALRTKISSYISHNNPILLYPKSKIRQEAHQLNTSVPLNGINDNNGRDASTQEESLLVEDKEVFTFEYSLYNWHERTIPGVSFHDTDILIASSNQGKLVISFAGTSSTADAFTNLQTFEFANHSSLFHGGRPGLSNVEGSIHRGFLNAYSRVHQGGVVRLSDQSRNCASFRRHDMNRSRHSSFKEQWELVEPLHNRYCHCVDRGQSPSSSKRSKEKSNSRWWMGSALRKGNKSHFEGNKAFDFEASMTEEEIDFFAQGDEGEHQTLHYPNTTSRKLRVRRRKSGGCFSRREKLVDILRDLVTNALTRGAEVFVVGHSLGGGVASLAALDIVVNFPKISLSRLALYTFGAPQLADDVFLKSCMKIAPRLKKFINSKRHFHRFTTISDDCRVDVVTNVTKRALASHKRNLRGRLSRKIGGVHGHIVHFSEPPYYLLTEYQYENQSKQRNRNPFRRQNANASDDLTTNFAANSSTKTSIAAHQLHNYLEGISRESKLHPLMVEMDDRIASFIFPENSPLRGSR